MVQKQQDILINPLFLVKDYNECDQQNICEHKFIFVDVDECEITELCKHNGTCINNNGSYICNCTDGWQGHHCEDGQYNVIFKKNC